MTKEISRCEMCLPNHAGFPVQSEDTLVHQFECNYCGMSGPMTDDYEEAIKGWETIQFALREMYFLQGAFDRHG